MTRKQKKSGTSWLFPALILFLLLLGGLVLREYLALQAPPESSTEAAAPVERRSVTLYFASAAGNQLVAESRELEPCPQQPPCYDALLQALIEGSGAGLVPVLPPETKLRSVTAEGETLTIDFSRELVDNHPGGSLSELLTVTALANTVAKNFPQLRQVRILVEGAIPETLKGHVSLREPVVVDFSLVQAAAGAAEPKQGAR